MTPQQRVLARHALGLKDGHKRSYRNHYTAAVGSAPEHLWEDLVRKGLAERGPDGLKIVGYCLTFEGASAALDPGETLDPEDFPEVVDQSQRA